MYCIHRATSRYSLGFSEAPLVTDRNFGGPQITQFLSSLTHAGKAEPGENFQGLHVYLEDEEAPWDGRRLGEGTVRIEIPGFSMDLRTAGSLGPRLPGRWTFISSLISFHFLLSLFDFTPPHIYSSSYISHSNPRQATLRLRPQGSS